MSETVLGFDVGTRRIGVAVGNDLLRLARPAAIVDAHADDEGIAAIAKLVDTWRPERLVVGMPLPLDGSDVRVDADADGSDAQASSPAPRRAASAGKSPALARCERFAERIGRRFRLPVERVDERYSSIDADQLHRDRRGAGLARRVRALDDVAAQVILQRYFDSLPAA